MANIYTNAKADLTTNNLTTVFTVPSDTRAIVKSFIVSNDSSSNDDIAVIVVDTADVAYNLFKSKTISANSTLDLLTNPLILTEGEILKVQATTADRLHVIISMLQINRD